MLLEGVARAIWYDLLIQYDTSGLFERNVGVTEGTAYHPPSASISPRFHAKYPHHPMLGTSGWVGWWQIFLKKSSTGIGSPYFFVQTVLLMDLGDYTICWNSDVFFLVFGVNPFVKLLAAEGKNSWRKDSGSISTTVPRRVCGWFVVSPYSMLCRQAIFDAMLGALGGGWISRVARSFLAGGFSEVESI